jgi:elongator complex protein 3
MTPAEILLAIVAAHPRTKAEFDAARTALCNASHIPQPANRALLLAYQTLTKNKSIARDAGLEVMLRKTDIRSQSGIAIVTSLVKPYACPGQCVYCPTEVRMPKSYIATEPAAARALSLDFNPWEQMHQRINTIRDNGHPTDKIEYIVKGGTWNAYPLSYQYWFVLDSFRAANGLPPSELTDASGLDTLQSSLAEEQARNETAEHRIIGLTLETRPDAVSPKTIAHMRLQGCTRIELGLQAPDDAILKLIRRGHTVQQFRDAMRLLREAGFKVDLHFMPDLPGTTPEHDVAMYRSLFTDPGLKPDMVKIYPNTVIKTAELYQWYKDGSYTPYGEEKLLDALLAMKLATPRWCRISRLIRDIPETDIEAGNKITNLREALSAELHRRGEQCVCLRCREIGRHSFQLSAISCQPQLFIEHYETEGGTEYFLSYEDPARIAVYGFLRLRIPHEQPNGELATIIPEINGCAFIRELHIYGQMVGIGLKDEDASQHKGLGRQLVAEAERIAQEHRFSKLAIISGVGVRGYYRKLGYELAGTYMVKTF